MIRYVPTSGSATAEQLSEALWNLSLPPQARGDEATTRMFPSFAALNGSVWLAVDTELNVPVHAEAELDGIADILQPWIDSGSLPADTNTNLAALIESLRGQRLTVWSAFPQFFKDQSKSREEMISLGLMNQL